VDPRGRSRNVCDGIVRLTAADPLTGTPARVRRGFRNIRAKTAQPASAPKPGKPGPGRPPGSKNRRTAPRHDVGKTTKRERTLKAKRERAG
jgi:hypothetical protein